MTFPLSLPLFKNQFTAEAEGLKAGPMRISQPFGATDYHEGRTPAQKRAKRPKTQNQNTENQ